jgi:hypothetical protein
MEVNEETNAVLTTGTVCTSAAQTSHKRPCNRSEKFQTQGSEREQSRVCTYFSVHDLEGSWARIAVVNSTSHEHEESDLCGEHQDVVQERRMRIMSHAG